MKEATQEEVEEAIRRLERGENAEEIIVAEQ